MEKSHSRQQMLKELAAGKSGRGSNGPLIKPGSEDEIQANYFAWVDLHKERFQVLKLIFAIPNAGFASQKQGALRKITGRRKGVPDVCVPIGRRVGAIENFNVGLWIEFKRPDEKPTQEQTEWHERLQNARHMVKILDNWVDAANLTIEYLGLPLEKL